MFLFPTWNYCCNIITAINTLNLMGICSFIGRDHVFHTWGTKFHPLQLQVYPCWPRDAAASNLNMALPQRGRLWPDHFCWSPLPEEKNKLEMTSLLSTFSKITSLLMFQNMKLISSILVLWMLFEACFFKPMFFLEQSSMPLCLFAYVLAQVHPRTCIISPFSNGCVLSLVFFLSWFSNILYTLQQLHW